MMKNRGFTLIETLVYLALFSLIIGGLVISAYGLFESSDRNQTKAMLQEESNFVMAKIVWAISQAQAICDPAANMSGATLSVAVFGGTCFPPDITIALSESNVQWGIAALNNSNTSVDRLLFIHTYAGGTNPDSVEVGLTISAKTPTGMTITQSASTTRYIRK